VSDHPYETNRYLTEYLLLHYGRPQDICPFTFVPREMLAFHARIRTECLLPLPRRAGRMAQKTRALDLGCGVGRFTFELGRVVDEVIGIDSSKSFVRAARKMAKTQAITIRVKQSGHDFVSRKLSLPRTLRRSHVLFKAGDATGSEVFAQEPFQIVAAINLICRLPNPRDFLSDLHRLVVPGGQLVVASPFTWMADYSPPSQWTTAEETQAVLRPHFRLARRGSLPFLIREHLRKYQMVISDVMVFVRQNSRE
jgi:SAM-dependent methyltransferase